MSSCINKKTYITAVCILSFLFACNTENEVTSLEDGFIVTLRQPVQHGATSIKLTVVTPKIIRVTAIAGNRFPDTKSLMRDDLNDTQIAWTEQHTATEAVLKTSSISATVSLITGEIVFKDSTGNIILQEKAGGGKTITPVEIDKKPLYQVSQVFESPADEAFYGLGRTPNRCF